MPRVEAAGLELPPVTAVLAGVPVLETAGLVLGLEPVVLLPAPPGVDAGAEVLLGAAVAPSLAAVGPSLAVVDAAGAEEPADVTGVVAALSDVELAGAVVVALPVVVPALSAVEAAGADLVGLTAVVVGLAVADVEAGPEVTAEVADVLPAFPEVEAALAVLEAVGPDVETGGEVA